MLFRSVGTTFEWSNLDADQKMALRVIGATTATEATAQLRLQFLRGDRSKEGASGGLRERSSVQGDIVNSTL